jgi:hypothetical protein
MTSTRYLSHSQRPPVDVHTVKEDILDALVYSTDRVQRHVQRRLAPDVTPDKKLGGGVYVGIAGARCQPGKGYVGVDACKVPP